MLAQAVCSLSGGLGEKLGQSDEVVGCDCKSEDGGDFGSAAQLDLGETGLRLDPTEHRLNALAAA
jgi:hypothetical protein